MCSTKERFFSLVQDIVLDVPTPPRNHSSHLDLDLRDMTSSGKIPTLKAASILEEDPKFVSDCKKSVNEEKDESEDIKDDVKRGPHLKTRIKCYIFLLSLLLVLTTSKFALPAPFYPQEARKKGASTTMVGLVFSLFEFVTFSTSPIFGRYMTHFGPTFLFVAGLFLSGMSSVVFGVLHMCPPGAPFVIFSLVIRALEALGFAALGIAYPTTLCHFIPKHYASVYAATCALSSLGGMLGPPIGAMFYEIGGFGLPFYVMGGVTVVLDPLVIFLSPEIKDSRKESQPSTSTGGGANSMSILTLAKSGLVWAGVLGLFMSALGNVFLQPVLSTHLETVSTPFGS